MSQAPEKIRAARAQIERQKRISRWGMGILMLATALSIGLAVSGAASKEVLLAFTLGSILLPTIPLVWFELREQEATKQANALLAAWTLRSAIDQLDDHGLSETDDPRWEQIVEVTRELHRLLPDGQVRDDVTAAREQLAELLRRLRGLERVGAPASDARRERHEALVGDLDGRLRALVDSLKALHVEVVAETLSEDAPVVERVHQLVARADAEREVDAYQRGAAAQSARAVATDRGST